MTQANEAKVRSPRTSGLPARLDAKQTAAAGLTQNAKKSVGRIFTSFKSVEDGIPATTLRALDDQGLTRDDIRTIIPDRTLDRRIADGAVLKIEEADGIARLLRVVGMARRVFGDDALADEWLRAANPALDGNIPIRMARTDLGGREVEAVLGRMEHGVFG